MHFIHKKWTFQNCAIVAFACMVLLVSTVSYAQPNSLPDFSDIVEEVGPSVVNIRTTVKVGANQNPGFPGFPGMNPNDPFFDFFRRFMPPGVNPEFPSMPPQQIPEREVPRGVGSGFIIDSEGYILTNHHVIEGSDTITVTLTDKREFQAKIIGSDQRTDVALVKIEGQNLPKVKIGNVQKTKVGQWVVAIGSPFGLENTVTAGIISAKARDTGEYTPFIQTDVAVNPGNSGGPLLNLSGEVVGINSQIYSRTGGFMGISFAIPIDEAMRVAAELRETGKVTRGRIGVSIGDVGRDVASALGLSKSEGALVSSVEKDGPAEKAGVLAGDIILEFNRQAIIKASDLPRIVGETQPGSTINMKVWRKGKVEVLKIKVGEIDSAETVARAALPENSAEAKQNKLGILVTDLNDRQKQALNVPFGVLVTSVSGLAASVGIRQDDVIIRLGQIDIKSADQFNKLVDSTKKGQTIALLIRRGDNSAFIVLTP